MKQEQMSETSWANTSNHTLKINITKPATTESPSLESALEKSTPQLDMWKGLVHRGKKSLLYGEFRGFLFGDRCGILSSKPRRSCLAFKGFKIKHCYPSAKLSDTEKKPVGEREHLAGLSHSNSPDIRELQIKRHEVVTSPANVACSLRALLMTSVQRNRREEEKDLLRIPGTTHYRQVSDPWSHQQDSGGPEWFPPDHAQTGILSPGVKSRWRSFRLFH